MGAYVTPSCRPGRRSGNFHRTPFRSQALEVLHAVLSSPSTLHLSQAWGSREGLGQLLGLLLNLVWGTKVSGELPPVLEDPCP